MWRWGDTGQLHPLLTPISPGQCITDRSRRKGYNSSQDLPNSVLDFVKLHPLMFEEVKPAGGEPLLVKKSVVYSRLAVDRVQALDGRSYDVLFMGTGEHGMSSSGLCRQGAHPTLLPDPLLCSPGDGWIHKAVVVSSGIHIVEEVQVFRDPQPVESLVISHAQVRGGRSGGTPHMGHVCAAAFGLFVEWGGHDSWVTPARDTCQSLRKGSSLASSCSHSTLAGAGVPSPCTALRESWISGQHGAPHSPVAPCHVSAEPVLFLQRSLYVGGATGILQVPLASCSRYTTCYDCILARDPYCAWDGRSCRATATTDR